MKTKSVSIRTQLYFVLIFTAALCVCVVTLSSVATGEALDGTQAFFACNSSLSDFYTTVTEMDSVARDWLYSGEDSGYERYKQLQDKARQHLAFIAENVDAELQWRLGLLANMLDYYQLPIDVFMAGSAEIYSTYSTLQYRYQLIRNTATVYYDRLATYLQSSSDAIQARWREKWIVQIISLSVLVLVGVVISSFYSKKVLRPIQRMAQNARQIQGGNFALEPVGPAAAELAVMAESFAEMTAQVERNMNVLKENAQLEKMLLRQESERLAMQNLVTQTELRSLQAQINPHFLFNTLSMISKSAYLSQDDTTSELIDRLAGFLRYALDKSSTTSTLYEEITSIDNYLFIQKTRFSGRLDVSVDLPDGIPNLKMPAIVLQPLVENAIKHGIDPLTEQALISLKVRFREGQVRIQIEDNGVGMSPEQLETLQSCLKLGMDSSSGTSGAGIGLSNVYRRLSMFFGSELQFNIESEQGCGTLITIIFPEEAGT